MSIDKSFKDVVDMLVELKDTSELMMDLAYSSIFLNSKELAQEVATLEEYIDDLHTKFELLVLTRCISPEESKDYLGLIRLGVVTEKIADAAMQIAGVVLRGLDPHPVLKLAIKEAEETVVHAQVSKKSPLAGKTLKEAQIHEETGMWVLCIKRGDKWIRPKPDTAIEAGDHLIASGYAEGVEDLKRLTNAEKRPK
ncbi:MAG TPA: TrkA C-terminal domain-containing protein [Candidatus Bathyarchaeia archaeon]|nr:TrkA C-terminal domain-containing protein [Candidatus Bathyarchaeia archaeon]